MPEDYLFQGIAAVKAGDKQAARRLLGAAVQVAPNDVRTWGWFYTVCANDEERLYCLRQVLRIDPKNQAVKKTYEKLLGLASPAKPSAEAPAHQPQAAPASPPQVTPTLAPQAAPVFPTQAVPVLPPQPAPTLTPQAAPVLPSQAVPILPPQAVPSQPGVSEPYVRKKWEKNRILLAFAGIATVLVCLFAIASIMSGGTNQNAKPAAANGLPQRSSPTSTTNIPLQTYTGIPTDTRLPSPTKTSIPLPSATQAPSATPDPNSIPPGTYLVGKELQPGLYRGRGGKDFINSCYWVRLKDLSGNPDSVIANENSIGLFYVLVSKSDLVFKTDCRLTFLPALPEAVNPFPQTILPGMYLVGRDIQPGLYQGQGGADNIDSCYWERLKDLTDSQNSIIANENSVGQFQVRIYPGDIAVRTGCELTRVGD